MLSSSRANQSAAIVLRDAIVRYALTEQTLLDIFTIPTRSGLTISLENKKNMRFGFSAQGERIVCGFKLRVGPKVSQQRDSHSNWYEWPRDNVSSSGSRHVARGIDPPRDGREHLVTLDYEFQATLDFCQDLTAFCQKR